MPAFAQATGLTDATASEPSAHRHSVQPASSIWPLEAGNWKLAAPYRPAKRASLLGVAAMRLISHSIADCGGIWLKPRRSVNTLSI